MRPQKSQRLAACIKQPLTKWADPASDRMSWRSVGHCRPRLLQSQTIAGCRRDYAMHRPLTGHRLPLIRTPRHCVASARCRSHRPALICIFKQLLIKAPNFAQRPVPSTWPTLVKVARPSSLQAPCPSAAKVRPHVARTPSNGAKSSTNANTVLPNPSLEPTRSGVALGPRGSCSYHPPRGPSATPALAAQLKR